METTEREIERLRSDADAAARAAYAITLRAKRSTFMTRVFINVLTRLAGSWRVEATRLERVEQERRWRDG